jgi:hypothetical protein
MEEGTLLGHIISKEGINIHPSKVEGILKIGTPRSKKEGQYLLGKLKFLRRFIPNKTPTMLYASQKNSHPSIIKHQK